MVGGLVGGLVSEAGVGMEDDVDSHKSVVDKHSLH